MSGSEPPQSGTAADLRRAFDLSFAAAPGGPAPAFDDFLAIRLGADAHLLPLAEVARLLPLVAMTRLPSGVPELLGLVGIAGDIVPVYDLAALLGYPAAVSPRWLVLAAGMPVALAFDVFEGQLRQPREPAAAPATTDTPPRPDLLPAAGQVRPVVPMASVLANIKSRALQGAEQKEQ